MFFRSSGRTAHIINAADTSITVCGKPAQFGSRWSPSDLPSGERNVFPVCKRCRPTV